MAIPMLQLERSADSPPPVRLYIVQGGRPGPAVYRRRRAAALTIVVLVVAVALALSLRVGAAALGGGPASAPELRPLSAGAPATFGGQRLVPGGIYVVQPGDTLWEIARAMQPTGDLDGLVDRLVRLNGGPSLAVGDRVRLPG